jgi:hypothetical protein
VGLKRPAAHGSQAEASALPVLGLNVPAGQRVHVDSELAPGVLLNVPAGHSLQVALEGALHAPSGQHAPAPGELKRPEVQLAQALLSPPLVVFARQRAHALLPLVNDPAGHAAAQDVAPRAAYLPTSQGSQALFPGAPAYLPGSQNRHAAGVLAPAVSENVPAGHGLQARLPGALHEPSAQHSPAPGLLYFPAAQVSQGHAGPTRYLLNLFEGHSSQVVFPLPLVVFPKPHAVQLSSLVAP